MDEPPNLPKPVDATHAVAPETNPYAPVEGSAIARQVVGRTELTAQYWGILAVALFLFVGVTIVQPALGSICLLGLVGAAIRVPLLQRRLTLSSPQRVLPNMFVMLLVSWFATLLIGLASFVAFCIICFPLGFATFSMNGSESSAAVSLVFGISGLAGLLAFLFLFSLSLRLSI